MSRDALSGDTLSQDRWPMLLPEGDGIVRAVWPERVIRYMLSDGTTLDVRTSRDDSDLRGALLDHVCRSRKIKKADSPSIAGSATLPIPTNTTTEVDGATEDNAPG